MKRLLWWLIAGTKGGVNRARIIRIIQDRPYNANHLAEMLELDYKTVRHHLKVLEENGLIISSGEKRYGTLYFLSSSLEANFDTFEEIWERIGEK